MDKHIRQLRCNFQEIIQKKAELLGEKKSKLEKPKANIRVDDIGNLCDIAKQSKIPNCQLKSAVRNHSQYTSLPLKCRHKTVAVYDTLFQEG